MHSACQSGFENVGHVWKSEESMAPGSSLSLIRPVSANKCGPSPIQRKTWASKLKHGRTC
jgi:hypothetical protein